MAVLNDTFTSTGAKFFHHQEAMRSLRTGVGRVVVTHIMATDSCNHRCAFCSVQARAGDSLAFTDILSYIDILRKFGLKATILSGGGNPILYKCKVTGKNFNDLVEAIHERSLEIGLITNGMPLKEHHDLGTVPHPYKSDGHTALGIVSRKSWLTVRPDTLDKITWIRISMAGLDHDENEVYVPDVDPTKTTLGFSYVAHDLYFEPKDPHHGKVSTQADLITVGEERKALPPAWTFEERIPILTEQIASYVEKHKPIYVRMLPNCLEKDLIAERCEKLQKIAEKINRPDYSPVFVQYKPPAAPKACYLGYIHPVLNSDGYVLPCDSCCLNESAGHKLGEAWRICHWSEIAKLYEQPVRSLIKDPKTLCPGCVFTKSNEILAGVVDGTIDITPPAETPRHANFV